MASILKFDNWQTTAGINRQTVLQVVQALKTDTFSTSATSLSGGAAVTGLSVTITPTSSSSRFFLMADGISGSASGLSQCYFWLARGSTKIGAATALGSRIGLGSRNYYADNNVAIPWNMTFVDSPATTSPITYNVYFGTQSGYTCYIGRSASDSDDYYNGSRASSRLTVFEIAS